MTDKQASCARSASKHLLVRLHQLQDHQETEQATHCKRMQDITQEQDSLIWLGWQGVMLPLVGEERSAGGLRVGIRPDKSFLMGSDGRHVEQRANVAGPSACCISSPFCSLSSLSKLPAQHHRDIGHG